MSGSSILKVGASVAIYKRSANVLPVRSFRPWKTPPLLVSVCALADIVKQRMIAVTHHLLKMDVGVVGLQPSVLSIFLFMIS